MTSLKQALEKRRDGLAGGHAMHSGFGYHYREGFNAALELLLPVVLAADNYLESTCESADKRKLLNACERLYKSLKLNEGEG